MLLLLLDCPGLLVTLVLSILGCLRHTHFPCLPLRPLAPLSLPSHFISGHSFPVPASRLLGLLAHCPWPLPGVLSLTAVPRAAAHMLMGPKPLSTACSLPLNLGPSAPLFHRNNKATASRFKTLNPTLALSFKNSSLWQNHHLSNHPSQESF